MSVKNRFAGLRDKVVDLLNQSAAVMENIVPQLGEESASSLSETFRQRANTVQNKEFVVVVVGEMNRGKSMLLNAMMHKQLLTMDVLECTATVNFLRYPKEEKGQSSNYVEVHFTNGRPPETVPVDKLADYTSRLSALGSDEVADLVHHVDAFVESPFLDDNVLLVDTPGTNTTTHNHIRITNDQIDRSNAAIFLFGAETQMTQSDRQFLEGVEEAVARLFFVVNKIDSIEESEVSRVLERVDSDVQEVVDQSKMRQVFGVSGAKALLGRTGYVKSPILAEDERSKLDNPQFRETLVDESGIRAFEADLERYLFGGGKGYDLLNSPLSFIQSETARIIMKLHRQIEVLDDTFDLSDLELKIEKMERIVEDRKHVLEGMTDELSEEISQALLKAQKDFEERCKLAVASLEDELNAYDSHEALKDNWCNGAQLADLPGRKLAALDRQAGKLLNDAVGRVLRKQTREIRRQVRDELGEIALELPEVPEMVLQLQEPKIDEVGAEKLEKLEREIEDRDRRLEKLDDAQAGINERHYTELQEEKKLLNELRIQELQLHGSRPEVRYRTVIEEKVEDVRGAGGFFAFLLRGKKRVEISKEVVDDREHREHKEKEERIEAGYNQKLAELDRQVKEARGKYDAEVLERSRAEKLTELNRNRQQALEQAKSQHRENVAEAHQRAVESTKGRLISTFQVAEETLKVAVESIASQTENMATDFIENTMAELDATLKDHNQELAKLKSLKQEKESERDTSKKEITRALEQLKPLQGKASRLEKEHRAFVKEYGEETQK